MKKDKINSDKAMNPELSTEEPTTSQEPIFKKNRMGFWSATSIVMGNVVGSGIFSNVSGTMSATPKSIGISLIIWTFGGLISIFGAVCYAELALYFKKSGGERTYLSTTFGTPVAMAFLYGYNVLVIPMATAFGALTTGTYIVQTIYPGVKSLDLEIKLIANAVIVLIMIINSVSSTIPAKIQIIFTAGKSLGLVLIICIGFYYLATGGTSNFQNAFNVDDFQPDNLKFALASSLWSYEGWNTLGHVAGQVNNPKKIVPLSFIFGLLAVIFLYLLTIISYTAVLGPNVVFESDAIGASLGHKVFGVHSWVITLFICLSTIGLVNGYIFTCPRISMTSGFEGEIPYVFGLVNRKTRVPVFANFIVAVNSIIFTTVPVGDLIDYSSTVSWTFYLLSCVVLFYIRIKKPDPSLVIKVPLVISFIVILASAYIIVMTFYTSPLPCLGIYIYLAVVFGIHYIPKKYLHNKKIQKFGGYIGYVNKVLFDMEMAKVHDLESVE